MKIKKINENLRKSMKIKKNYENRWTTMKVLRWQETSLESSKGFLGAGGRSLPSYTDGKHTCSEIHENL